MGLCMFIYSLIHTIIIQIVPALATGTSLRLIPVFLWQVMPLLPPPFPPLLPTILFLPPLPHPPNPLVFSSFFMALYDVLSSSCIFPAPDLESAIFPRNLHFFYCEMASGSFEVFGVCLFVCFLMFLLACNKFSKNTVIIIYMISSSIK